MAAQSIKPSVGAFGEGALGDRTDQMPMAGPCGKDNGICPGRDGERASQAGEGSGFGKDAKVAILPVVGERTEERGLGAGLHA